MDNLYIALWQFANGFLRFALVMIIGVLILKIVFIPIKRMLMKSKVDHTAKTFLFSLIRVILYGIVVITALGTAGVDISSLITALGAAALTAGLAFQDTLKNFVSGMILLFNKPIISGDLIQVDTFEGYVDSIRIFYTQIHTFDNRVVQIPNSRLTSNCIVNCSTAGTRRVDITLSVSYEDNLTKVKSVIYDAISKNPLILTDPEPKVYVSKHLDSGVEILVLMWTEHENYYTVLFGMEEKIKLMFDENGITIPYPHVQLVKESDKK